MEELFTCDECGGHQLEEVLGGHCSSKIKSIDKETGEIEYGCVTILDGEVIRYQCETCGHTVAENQENLCAILNVNYEE